MVPIARPPTSFPQPFPGAAPFINQSFPTVDISSLNMFPVSAGGKPVIPIPTMPSESLPLYHVTTPLVISPVCHHTPLSYPQCVTTPPCHIPSVSPHPLVISPVCHHTPLSYPQCVTTPPCHIPSVSPHPLVISPVCHHTPLSYPQCVTTPPCHIPSVTTPPCHIPSVSPQYPPNMSPCVIILSLFSSRSY